MTAADYKQGVTLVIGVVLGSLAGAGLRLIADRMAPFTVGSMIWQTLSVSAAGGALLGVILGLAIGRNAVEPRRLPLAAAVAAAIGTFGAAATLELPPTNAASAPFWVAALVNVGLTILAAGLAVTVVRRWPRK